MTEDTVKKVAEAMAAKREELIARPLAAIWPDLARAAIAAMSEWNSDMSQAPRDGSPIEIWAVRETTGKSSRYPDCYWGLRYFGSEPYGGPVWIGLQDQYSIIRPTHWRDSPLPPEGE